MLIVFCRLNSPYSSCCISLMSSLRTSMRSALICSKSSNPSLPVTDFRFWNMLLYGLLVPYSLLLISSLSMVSILNLGWSFGNNTESMKSCFSCLDFRACWTPWIFWRALLDELLTWAFCMPGLDCSLWSELSSPFSFISFLSLL